MNLQPCDLGPLEITPDAALIRAAEDRKELFRIAGQAALDRSKGGKMLDPEARAWAMHYAALAAAATAAKPVQQVQAVVPHRTRLPARHQGAGRKAATQARKAGRATSRLTLPISGTSRHSVTCRLNCLLGGWLTKARKD